MKKLFRTLKTKLVKLAMTQGFEIRKYPNFGFSVLPVFQLCIEARLNNQKTIKFVQIGGNDGIHVDPLYPYYSSNDSWIGHIFEPNPEVFKKLHSNISKISNRITAHPVAISDFVGESSLFVQDPETRDNASEISSMNKSVFLEQKDRGAKFYEIQVQTRTLNEFLSEINWKEFDILQIDTEGHEEHIFDELDLNLHCIKIIQVEIGHLNRKQITKITRKIANSGYDIYWGGHQADMVCLKSK